MDPDRQRIQEDLRGLVAGDVDGDPITCQLYATDASIYEMMPLSVVRPSTPADVSAAVMYAAENELAVHARGGGSGTSGESLGRGIVIDFSRHMRRMRCDPTGKHLTVQSGAVLADINRSLRSMGRQIGPDPLNRAVSTIGSVIAGNRTGSHFLRSGTPRDIIESLLVVSADGQLIRLNRDPTQPQDETESEDALNPQEPLPDLEERWTRGLKEIRSQFQTSGVSESNRRTHLDHLVYQANSGYRLDDVFRNDGSVDLAKFMCGSQGTLGLIVEATLSTEPMASHRGVILAFFHRIDAAVNAAVNAVDQGLVACDLIDRRAMQLAIQTDSRFAELPPEAEAVVLMEMQDESLGDFYDRMAIMESALGRGPDAAFKTLQTVDPETRNLYWSLSRRVIPRLFRVRRNEAPLPFIDDLAFPPSQLADALLAIQRALRDGQTTATFFAHVGQGHLRLRPFLNLTEPTDRRRIARLSRQIAEIAWEHGGRIGTQSPPGLSQSYLLPDQFGDLWQQMGQIKRLFDPMHRLNPGKLFGSTLQRPTENLRPADRNIEVVGGGRTILGADPETTMHAVTARASVPQLAVLQNWPPGNTVTDAVRRCNGCGRCRTNAPEERQCPVYRINPQEEATPRAKANLLRGVLTGNLSPETLATDEAKAVADQCFNCHQCRIDCPATVDIPKIVGEIKAQYVASNGLSISETLLSRLDTVAALASRFPRLANTAIKSKTWRFLLERLFGLSAARKLPGFAQETFLRHAINQRWHRPVTHGGLRVLYFVDHYSNYHDPEIGQALAYVLQHNNIHMYVPAGQSPSGLGRITAGDLKSARRVAKRNVRLLVEAVRMGYEVVATEPSAVLCLRHEYPNLLDDEDAHLL
ncbi:MAG: FAD-linked oxidase C-terminal domain-containing protein, partial [Planctomycetota bacterium]